MKNSARLTFCALLGSSLAFAGCGNDDGPSSSNDPARAPAARGAAATQAVTDLLELSNVASGGLSARAGALELVDVEDFLGDLEAGLDGAGCVTASLAGDDQIHVSFDRCGLAGDDLDGELDLTVVVKASGVSVSFAGNINIDGCGYDGEWSVDITGASIVTSGDILLSHNGIMDARVVFDASWGWAVGSLCPDVDLRVQVTEDGETTTVEIDNLDVCEGLCAADAVVTIESGGDSVTFTPADGAIVIGAGGDAVLLSCNASGDILFGDGDTSDLPNDDDPPAGADLEPRTGTWGYAAYTPIENNCAFADLFDSAGDFGLENNGNGTFTVFADFDPFDCQLDGADYYCPNMLDEVEDTGVATLTAHGTAEGTFSSSRAASGSREITVDCVGGDCALAESLSGANFPCTFTVSYNVIHLSDLY